MLNLTKLKGGANIPPKPPLKQIIFASIGGLIAVAIVGFLAQVSGQPLILGSFGASCVMLFGFPDLPFSQPRNVIGGHLFASLMGLICLTFMGPHWWAMAIALAITLGGMMYLKITHPPAGSNPLIVFLGTPSWNFLVTPTLLGAIVIVLIALIYNNLTRKAAYPTYW